MRTFICFLALLGLSVAAPPALPSHKNGPSELIIGGHRGYQGHFPYYVYLHNCGGTLITPTHVLTAAHCVDDDSVGNTVVAGLDDNEKYEGVPGVQIRKIVAVESHTYYNSTGQIRDDIAILVVEKPFEITRDVQLAKIKADDAELQKLYWGTAVGFGMSDIVNKTGIWPRYLQYAYIPVLDYDQCFKVRPHLFWKKQVCAGGKNVGVAHGDSGGPLSMNDNGIDYQIGIASYISTGQYRNQDVYPAVYTRTASYCDWMAVKTNGAFHCEGAAPRPTPTTTTTTTTSKAPRTEPNQPSTPLPDCIF